MFYFSDNQIKILRKKEGVDDLFQSDKFWFFRMRGLGIKNDRTFRDE